MSIRVKTFDYSPRIARSLALLVALACALLLPVSVRAQGPSFAGDSLLVPLLIDPERRPDSRPAARITAIRFLTEDDYPPFHYLGPEGALTGFNIDLARAICTEIGATCTIQPRRWDLLFDALETRAGDAIIASHRITPELRQRFEVSMPVYRVPARFVGRKAGSLSAITISSLAGRKVGVVGGSAHEAYLNALFPRVDLVRALSPERVLEAMRRSEIDLAFVDGVSAAFWLNGSESLACCDFIGGAYTESRFFGEGAGLVMRKADVNLRIAVDAALWKIARSGRMAKLYLKHFPVPFY